MFIFCSNLLIANKNGHIICARSNVKVFVVEDGAWNQAVSLNAVTKVNSRQVKMKIVYIEYWKYAFNSTG